MREAAGTDGYRSGEGTWREPQDLVQILNARAGISPEMAVRLSIALHVEKNRKKLRVTRLSAA